jgi:hypothetical protein
MGVQRRSGVTMNQSELQEQLVHLHGELERAPRLGADANRLLDAINADIARLRERAAVENPPVDPSLPDRLELGAVHFQIDHPTLAASLRRLIDILGKVGL